jgi:hypothetical protein
MDSELDKLMENLMAVQTAAKMAVLTVAQLVGY